MLRVLLKKQLAEVFKQYFFNAKKNKMRSKGAIAAWFFFFVVIMVGVLGGMFTFLSISLFPESEALAADFRHGRDFVVLSAVIAAQRSVYAPFCYCSSRACGYHLRAARTVIKTRIQKLRQSLLYLIFFKCFRLVRIHAVCDHAADTAAVFPFEMK